MGREIEPTEFEVTLAALSGLTWGELAERVLEQISPGDAAAFATIADRLSLEALRFLSARTLVRQRRFKTRG
jgi:hypothetical protein